MALWEVNNEIVFSDGALSISKPEMNMWVSRYYYKVPYSNVGKGGFIERDGKKLHTPSWTEVHPKTSFDDILVDKKPFDELFVEPKTWKFPSSSSDKEYTVKLKQDGSPYCDCWGYIAHRKCKHVKQVKEEL